jgi:hypothetical protein
MAPGGYIEMQEFEAWLESDDGSLTKDSSIVKWQTILDEASTKFGKILNVAKTLKGHMKEAGFKNVHDEVRKVVITLLIGIKHH